MAPNTIPATARRGLARPVGTALAARTRRSSSRCMLADGGRATRKTTVNVPSGFWPKCLSKIAAAFCELVPGTANDVESNGGRRWAATAPITITASQMPMTNTRQCRTRRVQRSSRGAVGFTKSWRSCGVHPL